jgi:hypothetical protein
VDDVQEVVPWQGLLQFDPVNQSCILSKKWKRPSWKNLPASLFRQLR